MLRIRPHAATRERGYFELRIETGEGPIARLVPVPGALPMLARWTGSAKISVDPASARIERPSLGERAVAEARRAFGWLGDCELRFDGVELFPEGSRGATRRYRKHIEAARRHDSAWDGEWLQRRRELVVGWPAATAAPRTLETGELGIAVALHLYYAELWGEIETLLSRWRRSFGLFVTLNAPDAALEARIAAAFPGASVRVVENRGRDVRPFLMLLEDGAFDGFDLVCKIHGKRSLGGGRLAVFGEVLRRVNFFDLIADDARVEAIIARFAAAPDLGLVGSRRFLSASTRGLPKDVLGPNRAETERLAARLNAPLTEPEFDFFEGTMFWVRPAALASLRALGLAANGFDAEAGRIDGAVEHALERLFNHVVRASGKRVESVRAE